MAGMVILAEGSYVILTTQRDIEEYAELLGMDLEKDKEYFWIAEAGLKCVPPPPWSMCRCADAVVVDGGIDLFFINTETGEITWEHPFDVHYRRLFLKEKAKNDPSVVVTLRAAPVDSGAAEVSVIDMGGDTLTKLVVTSPHETLQVFKRRVKQEVGSERILMVLPDGRALTHSDRKALMGELFDVDISEESGGSDGRGSTRSDRAAWMSEVASVTSHAVNLLAGVFHCASSLERTLTFPPYKRLPYNMASGCSSKALVATGCRGDPLELGDFF